MRSITIILLLFCLGNVKATAQSRYPFSSAKWDTWSRRYFPKDTNVIVQRFYSGRAAFMIKSKTPFDEKTNRVGFIDTSGKVVIKPTYTNASDFDGNYSIVTNQAGKTGTIDRMGKVIIPLNFDGIESFDEGLIFVYQKNTMGLMTIAGKLLVPIGSYTAHTAPARWAEEGDDVGHPEFRWMQPRFEKIKYFKNYLGVKFKDKWAVINRAGKEIIPPNFDAIGIFTGNYAVVRLNKKLGVTNMNGSLVIPTKYDKIFLSSGYAVVSNGENTGVLTLKNQMVIPQQPFERISVIKPDAFLVYQKEKCGVINNKDQIIIPIANREIKAFGSGYLVTVAYDSTAIYSKDGNRQSNFSRSNRIHYPIWEMRQDGEIPGFTVYNKSTDKYVFYDNLEFLPGERDKAIQIIYYRQKKWGVMDTLGREVTQPIYDNIRLDEYRTNSRENAGFVVAQAGKKWGIIGNDGKILFNVVFDNFNHFNYSNAFTLTKGDKMCLVMAHPLRQLTAFKYNTIADLRDEVYDNKEFKSFWAVQENGKWGFVNYHGKEITHLKYDSYSSFINGIQPVSAGGKKGLIDTTGREILKCIYNYVSVVNRKYVIINLKDKYGLMTIKGRPILPAIYNAITEVQPFSNIHLFSVIINGKTGLATTEGRLLVDTVYTNIGYLQNSILVIKKDKFGLLNKDGKVILSPVYDKIEKIDKAYQLPYAVYKVKYQGKTGIIDSAKKVIVPFLYDDIRDFTEKNLIVFKNGKYGAVSWQGTEVVPIVYENMYAYTSKYFVMTQNGKTGVLNTSGKVIIKPVNDYINGLVGNAFITKKNGKYGLVNDTGKELLATVYDNLSPCGKSILMQKDKLYGLIDFTGKVIYPCTYTFINCADGKVVEIY